MPNWPTTVKAFFQHQNYTENVDASHVNDLQDEVHAIEINLGAMPHQGNNMLGQATTFATVKARLDAYITGIITHAHNVTDGTAKLTQANTHQTPDTDGGALSLHHTLGTGANQAASGTHGHTNLPTSAITGLDVALAGVIPTGAVSAYVGAAAPAGWLLCDGSSKSRATYPALFAVIGTTYGNADGNSFNVPNMLGRVPLGAGSGAGLTPRTMHQPTTAAVDGEQAHVLTTSELASHSHANTAGNTTAPHNHVATHGHGAYSDSQGNHQHTLVLSDRGVTTGTGTLVKQNAGAGGDGTLAAGDHGHNITVADAAFSTGNDGQQHGHTMANANAGSGTAHNIMQPFTVVNYIVKT